MKKSKTRHCISLALAFLSLALYSEKRDLGLMADRSAGHLLEEISGERALDAIHHLAQFDRTAFSEGYDQACLYLLQALREARVEEAKIESFSSAWSPAYFLEKRPSWLKPVGWNVKKATFRVVDPPQKIADYDEEAVTLARMSRSFRGKADLVFVGEGTHEADYEGKDVQGKIVLARGYAETVHKLAVLKRGAIGVVCFGVPSDDPLKGEGHPEMEIWQVLPPDENAEKKPQYAFSISEEKGDFLLSLLKSRGRVEVEVDVQTEFYESDQKIVTARIPGRDKAEEEFVFYAHLDHFKPSAGDNASGCAALLEISRTLTSLIQEKKIPRPRRSIRFVWGAEGPGSLMYINAHFDRIRRTLAGLNLDMVGEDLEKTHSVLRITRTPDSLPSFLNDLVENTVETLDTKFVRAPTGKWSFLNYRFSPFSASSDHFIFNDGAVRVPMAMFNHAPDQFHHTNLDTPDKVDPTELKRLTYLGAAVALFVAQADDKDARDLAEVVASRGSGRIFLALEKGLILLRESDRERLVENFKAGKEYLDAAARREEAAVGSCEILSDGQPTRSAIAKLAARIKVIEGIASEGLAAIYKEVCDRNRAPAKEIPLQEDERLAASIFPRRTARYLNSLWQEFLKIEQLDHGDLAFLAEFKQRLVDSYIRIPEILNFVDGQASVLQIRNLVAAEYFGFITASDYAGHAEDISREYRALDIKDVLRLMTILRKGGLISY